MNLNAFLQAMPKIELHVHLEGSIRPDTLLTLAQRHGMSLPAQTVDGLRAWYTFTDFAHFIEIYHAISACIRTAEDVEQIARDFLTGQAAQNIIYSEVTFTPFNQFFFSGMSCDEQMLAVNRARSWGEKELGVYMGIVMDIPRMITPEEGLMVADWAISWMGRGVVALGLGGPEIDNPPEKFTAAFARARAAGLAGVPHAGETVGAESIWGALNSLHAARIGHGVRCLKDPNLVRELFERQIPLEICPTSNVCLKVVPCLEDHPLPDLLDAGLVVTLNSDDPPMFNTTLTEEYQRTADTFHFDGEVYEKLVLNALQVSFLSELEKKVLEARLRSDFERLEEEL